MKEQDKCKSERGPMVFFIFVGRGGYQAMIYDLSVKNVMFFLWLNYEIYATIFPFRLLTSFISNLC